ncbi:MAG: Gfo/Idh/MocA family oxidoreductase [Gemmatimonadota bacterium]|nr:Gfo/Idh/MocA family oxidoreductase [Gemmatimonadota bacterium]
MSKTRIAVVGAGNMARVRGRAFLDTGRAEICGVAARRRETAERCARELGCAVSGDDYRKLAGSRPDAVLIEVPHRVQDEATMWALDAGYDLLIGGCLASTLENGRRIVEMTNRSGRIVEAGFQRRYDPAWEEIRRLVAGGELGTPVMAVTMALWNPDPDAWYYDQEASGGMPLTHMSYCYLNAVRWILGRPTTVSAMANRKRNTAPGHVAEETCGALIGFENGAFASATASYIGPEGMTDPHPRFVCAGGGVTTGADSPPGEEAIKVYREGRSEVRTLDAEPSSMVRQAHAFLDATESRREALNPPGDALLDVEIAEAVSISAQEDRTVSLQEIRSGGLV